MACCDGTCGSLSPSPPKPSLSAAQATSLLLFSLWIIRSQSPAWNCARHASLPARDGFPRGQILRPVCWVICLPPRPAGHVSQFLGLAFLLLVGNILP